MVQLSKVPGLLMISMPVCSQDEKSPTEVKGDTSYQRQQMSPGSRNFCHHNCIQTAKKTPGMKEAKHMEYMGIEKLRPSSSHSDNTVRAEVQEGPIMFHNGDLFH